MLEKVINITPGSDYKKSAGSPKYYKKLSSYGYHQVSTNDSISISPATSLLASLGWKLKKFNNESEKLELIFELNEFEFETTIFFGELNQTSKFDYKVKKNINGFAAELSVSVTLSAPIHHKSNITAYSQFLALTKFFEQFKELSVKKPNLITDKYVIDSMVYDYRNAITQEFDYINQSILRFLEKYISFKPVFHHSKQDDDTVIIKSIQIQ